MGQPSQIPEEHWTENKRQVDAAQRAAVQSDPWLAFAPSDGLTLNEDRIPFDADPENLRTQIRQGLYGADGRASGREIGSRRASETMPDHSVSCHRSVHV